MSIGQVRETLDDLYNTPGKAELIGGRIVRFMATGDLPSDVGGNIYTSLRSHCAQTKRGKAKTDNAGYAVPELISGRESFCADASYYDGPSNNAPMRFIEGPPKFAAEVRSENDYGPAAEAEMAGKRADYFEAGTKAVWDVDPIAETVALYVPGSERPARIFKRGDVAHAEPAVPGWTVSVEDVFASE